MKLSAVGPAAIAAKFLASLSYAGRALLLVGCTVVVSAGACLADPAIVVGDSLGLGLAQTIDLPRRAHLSVSMRRGDVSQQFRSLPPGAIAVLSLGVNDAADPVAHLRPGIERVIAAAESTGLRFVWIGPPCVFVRWDPQAALLDTYLRSRLATTRIQFVSLRDRRLCTREVRTSDGIHFTHAGYQTVWEIIRRDAPFAAGIDTRIAAPIQTPATAQARHAPPSRLARRSRSQDDD